MSEPRPVFLTVVVVLRNQEPRLRALLSELSALMAGAVTDHELVVVDNASDDNSLPLLRSLTTPSGLPNLQVYALTKQVDHETAAWAGVENALGDLVAVMNPVIDRPDDLPAMVEAALSGADVVFGVQPKRTDGGALYKLASRGFYRLLKWLGGVDLSREAPPFRLLSKRVVNFILQHPDPVVTYRHIPATGGFAKAQVACTPRPEATAAPLSLREGFGRALRLMVSTTQAPVRLATMLSLLGAGANLVYSGYVVAIALTKADVAPGWVTLSLQQSGMFLLISLVLLLLSEYLLQLVRWVGGGPAYHVAQEFTSARLTRLEKLNIEETRAIDVRPDVRSA